MKKILTTAIAIALTLSMTIIGFAVTSYAGNNDSTPIDTTAPIDTTVPVDTTAYVDTTAPVDTTAYVDTTAPVDTTVATAAVVTEAEVNVATETSGLIANERYHRYYGEPRVYHNEDTMSVDIKNEHFHEWECSGCGYSYAETHDTHYARNADGHYDVCIQCGYKTTLEAHTYVNSFSIYYHTIRCDTCGYSAERHVGVSYISIDANTCQATCRECGISEQTEHDWDGFVCYNCNYALAGITYAIIEDIEKAEEGYDVYFFSDGEYHYVNMWDHPGCNIGDFVVVNHEGNNIINVAVMVDGSIVGDAENFYNYISDEVVKEFWPVENVAFVDLVIKEVEYIGDITRIQFGDRIDLTVEKPYVVYDLENCQMGVLEEDCAYLKINTEQMLYFICIW